MIQFVPFQLNGKEIMVTVPHLIRKNVNLVNGKEILTSQFYYDIINQEKYLLGEQFVVRNCKEKYPKEYAKVLKRFRKLGYPVTNATHLITDQGVFNILYVYGIDHRTLLKGGEKIPLKQNGLFAKPEKELTEDEVLERLFDSQEGLIKPEDTAQKSERIYNNRVYIRDFASIEVDVILGLNKELCHRLSKSYSRIQDTIDGLSSIYAQIYVVPNPGDVQLVIRFVPQGTPDSVLMARSVHGNVVTNISLKKTKFSKHIADQLLSHGLIDIDSRHIYVSAKQEAIIVHFTPEEVRNVKA